MKTDSAMKRLDETSPSVQVHLGVLQGVIERMAANSTSAKTWCITIISAVLVIAAGENEPRYILIALIPNVLFLFLDAYYLSLEKGFRNSYDAFVRKLHTGTLSAGDLYAVTPIGSRHVLLWDSIRSPSVWLFYGVIGIMIGVARWMVFS